MLNKQLHDVFSPWTDKVTPLSRSVRLLHLILPPYHWNGHVTYQSNVIKQAPLRTERVFHMSLYISYISPCWYNKHKRQ
jgi:hypothetical protein